MSVLKILVQLVKMIIEVIRGGGPGPTVGASLPAPTEPTTPAPEHTTTQVEAPPAAPMATSPATLDPNRRGSFLLPDVYPPSFDDPHTPQRDLPPYAKLVGRVASPGKEVVGCYIKASEGSSWGARNEEWFRQSWRKLREVGGSRYGVDWFRGAYHFLRFQTDPVAQANYFCDLIDSAGGWGDGDLMPWVDVEEGGQGNWAGGQKLEQITDPAKRKRLADEVTRSVTAFIARVKQRYPGIRVGVYGRGLYRDLRMTSCRFGGDAACNPAYTETMPRMDQYGWPLKDIVEWQICGGGRVLVPGYPDVLFPEWGHTDYSVYIDGANATDLVSFRRRALARPR